MTPQPERVTLAGVIDHQLRLLEADDSAAHLRVAPSHDAYVYLGRLWHLERERAEVVLGGLDGAPRCDTRVIEVGGLLVGVLNVEWREADLIRSPYRSGPQTAEPRPWGGGHPRAHRTGPRRERALSETDPVTLAGRSARG